MDHRVARATMRGVTRRKEQGVLLRPSNASRAMTPQCYETSPQRHLRCGQNPPLRRRVHKLSLNLPTDRLSSGLQLLPPPKCKCKTSITLALSSNAGTTLTPEHQKRLPYSSECSIEGHGLHTEIQPHVTVHARQIASSTSPQATRGNSSFQNFSTFQMWAMGGIGITLAEVGNVADLSKDVVHSQPTQRGERELRRHDNSLLWSVGVNRIGRWMDRHVQMLQNHSAPPEHTCNWSLCRLSPRRSEIIHATHCLQSLQRR